MLAIRIRAARSGDWARLETLIAGICRYHGDTIGLKRPQFDALVCADNAPMIVLVAETAEGIFAGYVAGYAMYEFQSGQTNFNIQNLYVAEEFRRQRVGETLLVAIVREARQRFPVQRIGIGS